MRSASRQWRVVLLVLVLAIAGTSACGDDDDGGDDAAGDTTTTAESPDGDPVSIPIVTVTSTETENDDGSTTYGFDVAQDLTAGPTQFNLANDGSEPHHMQIFRLNDGVTMEEFGSTLATGDVGALLGLGAFVGGTGTTDPGSESVADALVDLGEGNYVLLCFVENADGVPHLALGMTTPFSVGPAEGEVAEMPEPDATVDLIDFGFENKDIPASGVVEVVNTADQQLHEMNMFRLADGASFADVGAFFAGETEGPPPFASVGGMQALMPQGSQLLVLEDLDPADYVLICNIPDPADEVPHSQKGMAVTTTVT